MPSRRSPSARLPIWSWFCRKLMKADGARWPLGSPRFSAAKCRCFALIDEARGQRAGDVRDRRALVVAIIALALAGHQHAPGVMIIVVPLRAILALRRILRGVQNARAVVAVLQHQVNLAAGFRRKPAGGGAEIVQQREPARLDDAIAPHRAAARRSGSRAASAAHSRSRTRALRARDNRSRCPTASALP